MRIVVDTNIVFSALLNSNSKIAKIILQPKSPFNFYAPEFLLKEIKKHRTRIQKIAGYTESDFSIVFELITHKIRFINLEFINPKIVSESEKIMASIDIDDTEFVALTKHIKAKLWTGDKVLIKGLHNQNYINIVTTETLLKYHKINL